MSLYGLEKDIQKLTNVSQISLKLISWGRMFYEKNFTCNLISQMQKGLELENFVEYDFFELANVSLKKQK